MNKAIGMVEYKTVSSGIRAADLMIKTSSVEVIQASVVCPGKYIVLITGDLSAVKASVDAAKCDGCGLCTQVCPAGALSMKVR